MVSLGAGITLVPGMALDVEVRRADRSLVALPFAAPQPVRTISLAWRRSSARAEEFRLLGRKLAEAAPPGRRLLRR